MASQDAHQYQIMRYQCDPENNNLVPKSSPNPANGTVGNSSDDYVDPVEVARRNAFSRKLAVAIQSVLGVEQRLGFMTVDELLKIAKPGDMIEFNRRIFSHFAMYVGHGLVMNICAESKDEDTTYIRHESLKTASKTDSVRINNPDHIAWKYFRVTAKPNDEIVARAKKYSATFQPYELTFRNCEFYCTLWRYGVGFGTQTSMLEINPANYILRDSRLKRDFKAVFPMSRYHAMNRRMQENKTDEHIILSGIEGILSGTVIMQKYDEITDELAAAQGRVLRRVLTDVNRLNVATLPLQNWFFALKGLF